MKGFVIFSVILSLTLVNGEFDAKNSLLNAFIANSLNSFRDNVVKDPVQYPETLQISVTKSHFVTGGNVSNIEYKGLRNLTAGYVWTDLSNGFISFTCDYPDGIYSGTFNLIGLVSNTQLFQGTGTFTIRPKYASEFHGEVHYEIIDGYVKLNPSSVYMKMEDLYAYGASFSYPDLFNETQISGEVQQEIMKEVSDVVRNSTKEKIDQYLRFAVIPHLQEDFDQLSFDEIISGTTLPPRTTENPECIYDIKDALIKWGYSLRNEDHNEVILSSNIIQDDGHKIVMEVITKKTVIINSQK